jgi:hypothetical protein
MPGAQRTVANEYAQARRQVETLVGRRGRVASLTQRGASQQALEEHRAASLDGDDDHVVLLAQHECALRLSRIHLGDVADVLVRSPQRRDGVA